VRVIPQTCLKNVFPLNVMEVISSKISSNKASRVSKHSNTFHRSELACSPAPLWRAPHAQCDVSKSDRDVKILHCNSGASR
jgi:hypothetical protein